jgi:hypothetical protein
VVTGPTAVLNKVQSFNGSLNLCNNNDASRTSCHANATGCGLLKPGATPGAAGAYYCNFLGVACASGRYVYSFTASSSEGPPKTQQQLHCRTMYVAVFTDICFHTLVTRRCRCFCETAAGLCSLTGPTLTLSCSSCQLR